MDLNMMKLDIGEDQEIQVKKAVQKCMEAVKLVSGNLNKMNIIVMGKSGVGKSTLINNIFRGDFAKTGRGAPVTDRISKITKKDFPLTLYDTPGFELDEKQREAVKSGVLDIIKKGKENEEEAIHCIWYCVGVPGGRFEKEEGQWLHSLKKNDLTWDIPIIVVLTQSFDKNDAEEMQQAVKKYAPRHIKAVPVLAEDKVIGDNVYRAYGLDLLVDIMSEEIPDKVQDTLQNMQKVSLKSKKKRAQTIVATAITTSFGAGFSPLPFSDSLALIPMQLGMIAGITAVFGVDVSKGFITAFLSTALGSGGATIAGKTLVSNVLKFIPGVGTMAGGMISGTVAAALTTALGETYIKVMELIYSGEMKESDFSSKEGKVKLKEIFTSLLKREKEE